MVMDVIEVTSWPPDLTQWSPAQQPFYLEFFGETSPVLDTELAEVIPAGKADPQTSSPAPVYEYWWTLGHPGAAPHREHWAGLIGGDHGDDQPREPVWENLRDDVAARVYLYFPVSAGWRMREIVATVKYLTPVHQQQAWWAQVGQDLKLLQPLVGDAGTVAGLVPGGATASKWLETVGKMQVGSVPQSREFPWSVEKVTFGGDGGDVMQGVVWNLPASLLRAQGGRMTGSLAVSIMPAARQARDGSDHTAPATAGAAAKAHAGVYPRSGDAIWLPGPDARTFIDLLITPQIPGGSSRAEQK
jgi:hypothetical protein